MDTAATLIRRFKELFGRHPRLYRAPGRVNLIGEHTDYNDGFVLPAAVDMYCWVAIAPRSDSNLALRSNNFGETIAVDLDDRSLARRNHWSDYIVGTALALRHEGHAIRGADVLLHGEIPFGSGLSSSAAIEVASGFALLENTGLQPDLTRLAVACRRAENEFVGARVGIMDQFISAHGHAGHALKLDCRSLEYELLPLPGEVCLVVCNTGVKHAHAGGEYNQRRAQCEEGVRLLSEALPGIRALRDVSSQQLEENKSLLPELIYRRCRHIITEDERVERAGAALRSGSLTVLSELMAASHRSLRDDYEVSSAELDTMVEIASKQPGVIAARMTGGGFGGCTVNLVRKEAAEIVRANVAAAYESQTGIHPEIYVLSAARGVQRVSELESQ
jgi:galactokinase